MRLTSPPSQPDGGALRVLVVEDSWLWASAVARQLELAGGMEVVGPATRADEAIVMGPQHEPHVALVDVMLGDDSGLRVARVWKARQLGIRTILVTSNPTEWVLDQARSLGVAALVSKDDLLSGEEVVRVVRDAQARAPVASDRLSALEPSSTPYGLSPSDIELIRCLSRGMHTPEIARHLCLGQQTIRNRTVTIGARLGVSGRLEIVAKCLLEGIIEPPGRT